MKKNMFRCIVLVLLFVVFNQGISQTVDQTYDEIAIDILVTNASTNEPFKLQKALPPESVVTLNMNGVAPNASFYIVQIHTYQYNITLSYDKLQLNKISSQSVFGSNVGLYVEPTSKGLNSLYIKNDNVRDVEALFVIVPYPKDAPVPGGCNMEFDVEIAPYQRLTLGNATIIVDAQSASKPIGKGGKPLCDVEQKFLHHDMYRLYLPKQDFSPETYFDGISTMLTVENILKYGVKMPASVTTSPMRRVYSAYPGVGSVYAVVASYGNYSSAYVPAFTYACTPLPHQYSCGSLPSASVSMAWFIMLVMNFMVIGLKFKFPRIEISGPMSFVGGLIGYICSSIVHPTDYNANIYAALTTAVIFFTVTCCLHSDVIGVISGLVLGTFVASVFYFLTPDALVTTYLEDDVIFWTSFVTITLVVSFLYNATYSQNHSLFIAIMVPYLFILPWDYVSRGSLNYIIVNVVRRLTVPGFNVAIIHPPFGLQDMFFILFWILIALLRLSASRKSFEETRLLLVSRMPNYYLVSERTPLVRRSNR